MRASTPRRWSPAARGRRALLIATALLGAAAGLPSPARPQTFACSAENAGQLSVQANVQCGCRWFAASALHGTPAGYRWDCGILRARSNHEVPATANPYPYALPEALSIERPLFLDEGYAPQYR